MTSTITHGPTRSVSIKRALWAGAALGALAAVVGGCGRSSARTITWNDNAVQYRGQTGRPINVRCPPGGTPRSIWGTDTYSDDSSICTAAVHRGLLQFATGGVTTIYIQPGMPAYMGTPRNGVASNNYGTWSGSFSFTPTVTMMPSMPFPSVPTMPSIPPMPSMPAMPGAGDWTTNAQAFRGQNGMPHSIVCPPGGTAGSVWGTDYYTDDSSICTAAVHSGVIQLATGGPVTYFNHPGMPAYQGTMRNGVNSQTYPQYTGSFSFSPVPPVAAAPSMPAMPSMPGVPMPATWTQNATASRGQNGTQLTFLCPPGGPLGSVWGSGPYTDDSSICTAAVHAGRIQLMTGGMVRITVAPGMPAYQGSTANGVTSNNYPQYSGSFMVN